jgi:hypothetical protein
VKEIGKEIGSDKYRILPISLPSPSYAPSSVPPACCSAVFPVFPEGHCLLAALPYREI